MVKPKLSAFVRMRFGLVRFGSTGKSLWTAQRRSGRKVVASFGAWKRAFSALRAQSFARSEPAR
jgi:hypothetical protein